MKQIKTNCWIFCPLTCTVSLLCTLAFLFSLHELSQMDHSSETGINIPLQTVYMHMDSESQRFWKQQTCEIKSEGVVHNPYTSWFLATMHCTHMDTSNITVAICHQNCLNPFSCKELPDYYNFPVFRYTKMTNNGEVMALVQLPVSCRCARIF